MDAMLILFGMMKDEGCIRVHASLEIPHDLFWTGPPSKPSDSPDPFCFFFPKNPWDWNRCVRGGGFEIVSKYTLKYIGFV